MKTRIILFAAAAFALVACNKENAPAEGTSFVKGQKVSIGVNAPSTKVSATDDGTKINFVWQEDDKVLVGAGGLQSEFTLESGAGTATATFTGTMPASGNTYDICYKQANDIPTEQTYVAGGFPSGLIFWGEDCTLGKTAQMTPSFSIVQLNLTGTQAVSKIVVRALDAEPAESYTYTLSINPAVTLTSTATVFNVLTHGFSSTKLKVTVYDAAATPAEICSFTTTNAQNLAAGTCLNMDPKEVKKVVIYPGTELEGITIGDVTWAPVNCGYSSTYTYGLLYQWGRKYGQAYESGAITPTEMNKADDTEANSGKFGSYKQYDSSTWQYLYNWFKGDWFKGEWDNTLWNGSSKGTSDPCPTGWRVPSVDELGSLCYTDWDSSSKSGSTIRGSANYTDKGWDFGDVFLPAAGYRSGYEGLVGARDVSACYWSSSVNDALAWNMVFGPGQPTVTYTGRIEGDSVRCVLE